MPLNQVRADSGSRMAKCAILLPESCTNMPASASSVTKLFVNNEAHCNEEGRVRSWEDPERIVVPVGQMVLIRIQRQLPGDLRTQQCLRCTMSAQKFSCFARSLQSTGFRGDPAQQ